MVVLGLIGEKGSGKGTFTDILKEIWADKKIEVVSSSGILSETLKLWGIPNSRGNLQRLAVTMDDVYGNGTLTGAVVNRIKQSSADVVVFDNIRWPSDLGEVRRFPGYCVVYITAPRELRYNRMLARNEKVGEAEMTWEQFLAQEKAETEKYIAGLGEQADAAFVNVFSDRASFKNQIRGFCKNWEEILRWQNGLLK